MYSRDLLILLKHFHRPKDKKLIFNFYISINRDSLERREAQHFSPVVLGCMYNMFSTIPASALDMRHVYIRYFRPLKPSVA